MAAMAQWLLSASSSRSSLHMHTCAQQDCIRLFTQRERMSGDNKWKCPKCNALREVEKAIEIWKLPPILIIILKRLEKKEGLREERERERD